MYAAGPRIIPACVIAGVVIVGDIERLADIASVCSIAFASPKVQHLRRGITPHPDVRGPQITMNDVLLVRRLLRLRDLLRDGE
jgi:hypothetical protein